MPATITGRASGSSILTSAGLAVAHAVGGLDQLGGTSRMPIAMLRTRMRSE